VEGVEVIGVTGIISVGVDEELLDEDEDIDLEEGFSFKCT
jgi:hypothetical protein